MDSNSILLEFKEYPNVSKGVEIMFSMWRGNQLDIEPNIESVSFKCSGRRVDFRIEFPKAKKIPRIVVYSGIKDPERGSPLVKGASQVDIDRLKYLLGKSDTEPDKPDWYRDLYENVSEEFYRDFIDHASRMCRNL